MLCLVAYNIGPVDGRWIVARLHLEADAVSGVGHGAGDGGAVGGRGADTLQGGNPWGSEGRPSNQGGDLAGRDEGVIGVSGLGTVAAVAGVDGDGHWRDDLDSII